MRVTSTSYYNNIYGENNKLNQQLFDVNKQISSGQKIQYAHENPSVFLDTLRLDDEITTLTQTKNSSQDAYKISAQTDTTIGEIVKTIESMKVKLINAVNSANSDSSTQAIARELRGLKNHLVTLANTSIGGKFLFSGTETSVKPIDNNGTYHGNNQDLQAFMGSDVKQKYNISGSQLFLGNENNVNRTISTNVPQLNLTELYPDIMQNSGISRSNSKELYITPDSTIRDLMGDTNSDSTDDAAHPSYFYLQGTRSNGSSFKTTIEMGMTDKVDDLLQKISLAYHPDQTNPKNDQVNVSLNAHGQIEIIDKRTGFSKLDFHMVGAIDFSDSGIAETQNIDDLQLGTTDFQDVIDSLDPATTNPNINSLYLKEFTKSGLNASINTPNSIEGINYDRTNFLHSGASLTSNVPQITKSTNQYATPSTKLIDVGSFTTNTIITIEGNSVNGNSFLIPIDLGTDLLDENGNSTDIEDATYQQLLDAVNMAMTDTPTPEASYTFGKTSLTYDGRIIFTDLTSPNTSSELAIYDTNSNTYPASGTIDSGASMTFNTNGSLSIRDPKTDFFTQIEEIIRSVEEGKIRSNGLDTTDPRNVGIQNSIQMIDDLAEHVSRLQAESGSYSQVLQASSDRSNMLIMNTKMLQSDVLDTDIAEATLRMQQLSLNYQAMLSSISKVSKLSLVNYL